MCVCVFVAFFLLIIFDLENSKEIERVGTFFITTEYDETRTMDFIADNKLHGNV